jgi:ribonuclease VapC
MVLDTSAIIAIAFDEPERHEFLRLLGLETRLAISAVTYYEASVVAVRKKQDQRAARATDAFIESMAVEVVQLDIEGAQLARAAYFRFGRGFHPAGLNFADCFSYALAKARDEALLFKGDDFLKTDIVPAWRP